jgi:hypothetical protein
MRRDVPKSFIIVSAMMQPMRISQVASTHRWTSHHHQ